MNTPSKYQQASAVENTELSRDLYATGPVERGINTSGLIMTASGSVISLISREIGYAGAGTGVGLVAGGLAVGSVKVDKPKHYYLQIIIDTIIP